MGEPVLVSNLLSMMTRVMSGPTGAEFPRRYDVLLQLWSSVRGINTARERERGREGERERERERHTHRYIVVAKKNKYIERERERVREREIHKYYIYIYIYIDRERAIERAILSCVTLSCLVRLRSSEPAEFVLLSLSLLLHFSFFFFCSSSKLIPLVPLLLLLLPLLSFCPLLFSLLVTSRRSSEPAELNM